MDEAPEWEVLRQLAEHRATVAVAESLTGGLVGQRLTAIPGSSATFRGGVIAYAGDVKTAVLGVSEELLATRGAVDPEVAFAMANSVRIRLKATYGLGLTGIAGPGSAEGKTAGTVHVALAGPDGQLNVVSLQLAGDRLSNREQAATAGLDMLRRHLVLAA